MRHIILSARQLEPNLLHVKDVTPLDQAEYLTGLTFYELSVSQQDRLLFTARTSNARDDNWLVNTLDHGLSYLPSGVYVLRLEAVGFPALKRTLSNFYLRLAGLELHDRVWVRQNGGYLDQTAAGTYEGGDWVWQITNTFDTYDRVEVRHGDGRLPRVEHVIPEAIRQESYPNQTQPVTLAAGAVELVCCRAERRVWAQLVHRQVLAWQGQITDRLHQAWVPADEESRLHSIGAELTLLENGHITDGVLASQQLRLTQAKLAVCRR